MRLPTALLAGALFGAGLVLSGMTDTRRVQGFLDIFGAWDPTLAFVMGGALLPMALAWRLTARRACSLSGRAFPAPPAAAITRPLVLGSALFGAGWGLVGLCPGPALATAATGGVPVLVFLIAMAAGMVAAIPLRRRADPRPTART
jgi:uncharacterized membrane protein YedE/YeeE